MKSNNEIIIRLKKWIKTLEIVLIIGIFIHLLGTLIAYTYMYSNGFIEHAEQVELIKWSSNMRQITDNVRDLCLMVFYIGSIMATYIFMKSDMIVIMRKIFFLFGRIIMIMIALVVIFSIINPAAVNDFLYPLWSVFIFLAINFVVVILNNYSKQR